MGTSQSNPGPGGRSPLVPPWADDQPSEPLPEPAPQRFKPFRQALGSFVSGGDGSNLRTAVGHYARGASGGGGGASAARRLGSVTQAGGGLYGLLSSGATGINGGQEQFSLQSLSGKSCDEAIAEISKVLSPDDGDGDKIRASMAHALAEALDGVEVFDPACITDSVIVDTMIGFLAESVFLQIVMDGGKAWNKAETPAQALRAESELRELIKVVVDKHMGPKMGNGTRPFSRQEIISLERTAIMDVWTEWEEYR